MNETKLFNSVKLIKKLGMSPVLTILGMGDDWNKAPKIAEDSQQSYFGTIQALTKLQELGLVEKQTRKHLNITGKGYMWKRTKDAEQCIKALAEGLHLKLS